MVLILLSGVIITAGGRQPRGDVNHDHTCLLGPRTGFFSGGGAGGLATHCIQDAVVCSSLGCLYKRLLCSTLNLQHSIFIDGIILLVLPYH